MGEPTELSYAEYKITDWFHGFKPADNTLGLVGAYIAVKDDTVFGFSFMVSTVGLALSGKAPPASFFEPLAKQTMAEYLDGGDLVNREEYTFEYDVDQEKFLEIQNPTWWIKSKRRVAQ